MEKTYTIIAPAFILACMLLASCAKEETTAVTYPAFETLTISGSASTKTILRYNPNETYSSGAHIPIDWIEGDAISVFATSPAAGRNNKFTSSLHSEGPHLADFSGKIEGGTTSLVALYPYDASATYTDGTISTKIPTNQTATPSTFQNGAAVTLAKATKGATDKQVTMEFSNLCSYLIFKIPENINATQVKIEPIDDTKMTGAITIDCTKETPAITSAAEKSVVLTGTFTPGSSYCAVIAPGNYSSGFTFTLSTAGGNTFVREGAGISDSKSKPGGVYNIGTLSLAADAGYAKLEVSINHTYADNKLTGSDAVITLKPNVPSEFSDVITGWFVKNVTIKQDGVTFRQRTEKKSFTNGKVTIDSVSGKPYMPHTVGGGIYDYRAEIWYTVDNGEKSVERKFKTISGSVTSPLADTTLFKLEGDPTGYTSYSVYKGLDGQTASATNANTIKNDVIKGIGATYKSGLSKGVYDQCSNLLSFTATLDGSKASGDSDPWQSWGEHKIKCDSATFDGRKLPCSNEKTVYITGVPYSMIHPANNNDATHGHPWTRYQGNGDFEQNRITMTYSLAPARKPLVILYGFKIPQDINVYISGNIKTECTDGGKELQFKPNGTVKDELIVTGFNNKNAWVNKQLSAVMTSGDFRWEIFHDNGNATKMTYIYDFIITYRKDY